MSDISQRNDQTQADERDREEDDAASSSKHNVPAAPSGDDESPMGDTDQHSDA